MNATWLLILSVVLCFDTLAISISIGINDRKVYFSQAFRIAFVFAVFQGALPLLGWLGGKLMEKYISSIDHWIASVLLFVIGLKMIYDAFQKRKKGIDVHNIKLVLALAFATSIDAFAVGVSLGITNVDVWIAISVIALMTGITAMLGMLVGKKLAALLGTKFEIVGGLILIALGVKILLEHIVYL